jgi:hypothetical protein
MEPAGEMWSVVMESPNSAMILAPVTEAVVLAPCSSAKFRKNGGSAM